MIVMKIDQTIEKWKAFEYTILQKITCYLKQAAIRLYELCAHTDSNGKWILNNGDGKMGKMEKSKHKSSMCGMGSFIFLASQYSLSFDKENY